MSPPPHDPRERTTARAPALPICFPAALRRRRKQNAGPSAGAKVLFFQNISGAGDEIRTHDPNLGKVVLYP